MSDDDLAPWERELLNATGVTIPQGEAVNFAHALRSTVATTKPEWAGWAHRLANLLDPPPPPSLREKVAGVAAESLASCMKLPVWMQAPALGRSMTPLGELIADPVLAALVTEFHKFADEHCYRGPDGDYAISTKAVTAWLRGQS